MDSTVFVERIMTRKRLSAIFSFGEGESTLYKEKDGVSKTITYDLEEPARSPQREKKPTNNICKHHRIIELREDSSIIRVICITFSFFIPDAAMIAAYRH
jgi:hypothetical protein